MHGFAIEFSQPWLLFLLIPAFAFTLIPYFLLNKRYRRTRNRIISMVLHLAVLSLAIFVLADIRFTYREENLENELLLLVDVSDTQEQSADRRDAFVKSVIDESRYDSYKVGVVTFGFDQVYAAPLTYDTGSVYGTYLAADLPDTGATDIAAALSYARTLFEHPQTAKIVLITDGRETDESAATVIRSISAQGIKVDTVYISSAYENDNIQLVGVEYPAYHIGLKESVEIKLTLSVKEATIGTEISMYDNGQLRSEDSAKVLDLEPGLQQITFLTSFEEGGLHEINFRAETEGEQFSENNELFSYFFLGRYNRVLIFEQQEGESEALEALLGTEEADFEVTVCNLKTAEEIPDTVDELREYGQIVLNNIAFSDFPEGMEEMLRSYVYDYGGGLFTTGGTDSKGEAHAYDREDVRKSTSFRQMLPVEVIKYTPPIGVELVIDISGSMTTGDRPLLEAAQAGAIVCLNALEAWDYVGVMTLDTEYGEILQPTPVSHKADIVRAIQHIGQGGSTVFSSAIARAGERLKAIIGEGLVDKGHIIIVTDGMPTEGEGRYLEAARNLGEDVSLSVVGLGQYISGNDTKTKMTRLIDEAGGKGHLYLLDNPDSLGRELYSDLSTPALQEMEAEEFNPNIENEFSKIIRDAERMEDDPKKLNTTLGGFFGVKAKSNADVILTGSYSAPLYAQWKYGEGMVGSFMCDLTGGEWSKAFLDSDAGKTVLINIFNTLMPMGSLQPQDVSIALHEENYLNTLSVYSTLKEGETLDGQLVDTATGETVSLTTMSEEGDVRVTSPLSEETKWTRCTFVVKKAGVYRIVINKKDAEGKVSTFEAYKSFSYSEEYDTIPDEEFDADVFLADLAERGGGRKVEEENPWDVFLGFITSLEHEIDPRMAFMIVAMVLFLLDIVVRKFKFKWIHEIVREHREKEASREGRSV